MKKEILKKLSQFTLKERLFLLALLIGILILLYIIAFVVGKNAKIDQHVLDTITATAIAHDEQINDKKEQISGLENQISELENTLTEKQEIVNAVNEYQETKDAKAAEISDLDNQINDKSNTVVHLDSEISSKNAELDQLKNLIQRTGEEPKKLPAGQFTVGTDLPEGRYLVSGSSNFVVHSAGGKLKVNTILGNSSVGDGDYVCTLSLGDEMELHARTTFTPIK